MKYRKLGSSDLLVSEIAFGSWLTFSSAARRESAVACVHRALDRGITLFDTANVYGLGEAERVLGEALAGIPRDSVILATKLFFPMSDMDRDCRARKSRSRSMPPWRASRCPMSICINAIAMTGRRRSRRPCEALTRWCAPARRDISAFPNGRSIASRRRSRLPRVEKFVSSQPQYSLLHREPERALFPLCAAGNFANRLVAARAGPVDGKICPRGAAPPRTAAPPTTP